MSQSPLPSVLYAATIVTDTATGELLDELLPSVDLFPTSYFDADTKLATMSFYHDEEEAALELSVQLRAHLAEWAAFCDLSQAQVMTHQVLREDWAESWKRFFHTQQVSERITIKPAWERYQPTRPGEIVIDINPGMSFGTGSHGTTKACLQFIDEACIGEASSLRFLDLGCGSGILAMAAAKLGCGTVHAVDYDPEAVRCTLENMEGDPSLAGIRVWQADLTAWEGTQTYQLVAANILASVLLQCVPTLLRLLAGPGSQLLLSGILTTQFEDVRRAFEAAGLKLVESVTLDEWTSGRFVAP